MAQKEDDSEDDAQTVGEDGQHHNSPKRYPHPYDGPESHSTPSRKSSVDIHDPMFLWIMFLMVAVVIRILLANTKYIPAGTQAFAIASTYSTFLLTFPGIIILPLIMGIVIGSEVGERSNTLASALRSGLTNGIYASIIYLVTIVIIYIMLNYSAPQLSTLYVTALNSVVLPILVFMLTLEIIAVLAFSRRVDA